MDRRYTATEIDRLFRPEYAYATWMEILVNVAQAQAEDSVIPAEAAQAISSAAMSTMGVGFLTARQVDEIRKIEEETAHDVAAFLYWFERQIPDGWGRYLHYGLTSSDLVDTAMGFRFSRLSPVCWAASCALLELLSELEIRYADVPMLAHTHGQPAEPTRMGLILGAWGAPIRRAATRLDTDWIEASTGKLSGPVGTYAHNPPQTVNRALARLGLVPDGNGSQIVSRDRVARWASSAAQLVDCIAKVGLDFRLMAARGEAREGQPHGDTVGSSSMPHKINPVRAEQLSGLARLAAGYAQMLQTTQLWEQRDISHSCVERVAIPDLMHVTVHAVESLTRLLRDAVWNTREMGRTLSVASRQPYSAWAALRAIDAGLGRREARGAAQQWVRGQDLPGHNAQPEPGWFTRSTPTAKPSLDV